MVPPNNTRKQAILLPFSMSGPKGYKDIDYWLKPR